MGKLYIEKETNKEISIWTMYELVFKDMVESYLSVANYNEKTIDLTDEEIKDIANKMIYKNEHLWEIINETIDNYIGRIMLKRGE